MTEATQEQVSAAVALVVRGTDPRLPSPWIFDGTRRMYENGKPSGWIARAVDLSGARKFSRSVPLQTGEGTDPQDATVDLVMRLSRKESSDDDDSDEVAPGRG